MTPRRARTVEELCQLALEREPRERAAFVAALCPDDPELTRAVEAALTQIANSEDVRASLDRAHVGLGVAHAGTAGASAVPWLPEAIGRYRLLRLVGEGGMGSVYEAEQDHPRRAVALKVIKPGFTTPETLRRFERESQALGRLQHPGIAQIYDAGTADAGLGPQPYFAMEFILGETLTDYATAHQLDTRQRLELVARICDAVQHAHDRGLIHRDLKPGNILVDATTQPKILDFGVARLIDSDAHATRQTDLGQLVGTLAYMSPEQVLADPTVLDARSDVYALGVILYELLAGRLPYTISSRLHEAVLTIRDEDPGRLSSINRIYRGDIETIVAKALEKDKTRRYASAAALGDDLRRHLADQPITARSASATYHLQKFARRHKALVGGMIAVFIVLVAGIVASSWQALRARRAEGNAVAAQRQAAGERDEATRQRNLALAAEQQAQQERNRALEAQARAQDERNQALAAERRADTEAAISRAVSAFLQNDLLAQAKASEQSGPDTKPDPDLKVRTALDRAAARIGGKFGDQPHVEASIRQTIGSAYQELGLYAQARPHLERAYELRRRASGEGDLATTEVLGDLAALSMVEGKYKPAEALYLKTLQGLRRAHGDNHPDVLKAMSQLAELYQSQGRYGDAEALIVKVLNTQRRVLGAEHPNTLASLGNLAATYYLHGKYADAEPLFVQIVESQRRVLGPDHPDTLTTMANLALAYQLQGKQREAESQFVKALEAHRRVLGNEHPFTLAVINNLGLLFKNQRKYSDAEPLYLEVLAVRRRVLGEEHPDTLASMNNLGALYVAQNRYANAEPLLANVLEARKEILGAEHPNTLNTMANLGQVYFRQGRFKEAESLYEAVMTIRRRVLGEEHPDTLFIMGNLGTLYMRENRTSDAESLFAQVLEVRRRKLGDEHAETLRAVDNLAGAHVRRGDLAQAETLYTRAFEGRRRVFGADNPDTLWSAQNLATVYGDLGRIDQAVSLLMPTLETTRRVLGADNANTMAAMERLAEFYRRQGKYDQAQTLLAEALQARRRVFGAHHPDTIEDLARLAFVHLEQHEYAQVESELQDLVATAASPTETWFRFYGESILGAALAADKKYAEAERFLIDGHKGMSERAGTIPADGKAALDRAVDWIVQLYQAWGKPERAAEWSARRKQEAKTPQKRHP
jgi:hypothetical protein